MVGGWQSEKCGVGGLELGGHTQEAEGWATALGPLV